MDNPITKTSKRKSLIDRLDLFIRGKDKDVQVETRKRPLMERLNEKIHPIQEKYDKWNDDMEVEILNETETERSKK